VPLSNSSVVSAVTQMCGCASTGRLVASNDAVIRHVNATTEFRVELPADSLQPDDFAGNVWLRRRLMDVMRCSWPSVGLIVALDFV
jgi:hypothetical protein